MHSRRETPSSEPFAADQLRELSMFEDTRMLARALFPVIGSIVAAADRDDESDLLRVFGTAGMG